MDVRLSLVFLLLLYLNVNTALGPPNSGINFANSDYDFDGCGTPGMRTRVRRSESAEYDEDEEDDDDYKDNGQPEQQAYGGSAAANGESPWAVAIMTTIEDSGTTHRYETCAGTLISRRHVATAAHCLMREKWRERTGGEPYCHPEDAYDYADYIRRTQVVIDGPCLRNNTKEGCTQDMVGKRVNIANLTIFPFFDGECEQGYDLVILTLSEEAKSNHACLPWLHDIVISPPIEVESFGWGESLRKVSVQRDGPGTEELEEIGKEEDNQKQIVQLGTTDFKCNPHHKTFIRDKICVPEKESVAVCRGDSGAGLLTTLYRRTYVLGVLSLGTACINMHENKNEATFTNLGLFQATIDKEIGTVGPYPD